MTQTKTKSRRSQADRIAESDSKMIQAAVKLIASKGPRDMTLADVGALAGYSGGLVSHRFGSKSGLLVAVADRIVDLFVSNVLPKSDVQTGSIAELFDFLAAYARQVEKQSDLLVALYRLMTQSYGALPELQPTFERINHELMGMVSQALKNAIETGEVRADIDPEMEAVAFIAELRGLALLWFVGPKPVSMKAFVAYRQDKLKHGWGCARG